MTELYREIIQCDKINRKYRIKFFLFDSFNSIKTNLKNTTKIVFQYLLLTLYI